MLLGTESIYWCGMTNFKQTVYKSSCMLSVKKKPRILCGTLKELAFPGRQEQEAVERTVSEMLAAVSEYIWSVGLILGERG